MEQTQYLEKQLDFVVSKIDKLIDRIEELEARFPGIDASKHTRIIIDGVEYVVIKSEDGTCNGCDLYCWALHSCSFSGGENTIECEAETREDNTDVVFVEASKYAYLNYYG